MGFDIETDLNTPGARVELWLEWKRRSRSLALSGPTEARNRWLRSWLADGGRRPHRPRPLLRNHQLQRQCSPRGELAGVTTTSGLAWKIPGRVGDSPILGAGLYVDGDVGAAGSTGRGEANLYGLCSFLIIENMRRGMRPKDAGIEALRRIKSATVEQRLLNSRGEPNFNVNFYILNARGDHAGVALYARPNGGLRCMHGQWRRKSGHRATVVGYSERVDSSA